MTAVDLNADVGESYGRWQLGDDAALLPLLTSANVACGFHAGDPLTLRRTVALAAAHDVHVGAQVSYPDLAGFGRRAMDVSPDELEADVLYQLGALEGLCRAAGTEVRYLKPHGALYHRTLDDEAQAGAVVAALLAHGGGLPVLTTAGSALAVAASAEGVRVVSEGFADRRYDDDGRLVPRSEPGALLTDAQEVGEQAVRLAATVDSLCLHGDTPGAPALARAVREALAAADVAVEGFA
jgi:UPF0271 protein